MPGVILTCPLDIVVGPDGESYPCPRPPAGYTASLEAGSWVVFYEEDGNPRRFLGASLVAVDEVGGTATLLAVAHNYAAGVCLGRLFEQSAKRWTPEELRAEEAKATDTDAVAIAAAFPDVRARDEEGKVLDSAESSVQLTKTLAGYNMPAVAEEQATIAEVETFVATAKAALGVVEPILEPVGDLEPIDARIR